jgi:CHASE2 domain-containing sensor protein
MAHAVFISYVSEDLATAEAVCHGLEALGVCCWIAPRDIPPGMEWPAAIIDAITQSRALVLIFSSHTNQSHQVPREIERAVDKGIPVICLRIERVEPTASLEYFMGVVHWVDAMTSLERSITRVADAVRPHTITPVTTEKDKTDRPFRPAVERFQQRLRFRNTVIVTSIAIAVVVSLLAVMSVFDLFTLDTRLASLTMWAARPLISRVISPDLTMVAVGNDMPLSEGRRQYAVVIDRLSEAGAKVIAFDMYFESSTPDDELLRRAIERARQRGAAVIVGVRALSDGQPKLLAELRDAVSTWGMPCIGQRLGSAWIEVLAVEKGPLAAKDHRPFVWSLALRAVAAQRDLDLSIDQIDLDDQEIFADHVTTHHKERFRFSTTSQAQRFQKGCPIIAEGDRVHYLMIALSPLDALREPVRRFTYSTIMASTPLTSAQGFNGKIVLLGVESSDDTFQVPGGERRFGFELHADAINTLLMGITIRPLSQGPQLAISIVLALVGGTIRYARCAATKPRCRLILLGTVGIYIAMTLVAYSHLSVLLSPLYHLGSLVGAYLFAAKVEVRWFR